MEHRSNAAIAPAGDLGLVPPVLQIGEDSRLPREAVRDLQIVGIRRSNLLLEGPAGAIRAALGRLWPGPDEPMLVWSPGQPLELPPTGRVATLLLCDVSELTLHDQLRLLRWLDQAVGRIRVVSTSAVPVWPLVNAGRFNDVLYYRLNTVCVDLSGL